MAKILIIDDEALVRDNLVSFLEDEGHSLLSTSRAESGLMRMQVFQPDLVIVDLRLQGINGESFVHTAHNLSPKTRFIIHTGSKEYTISEQLRLRGITEAHVLYKPVFDLNELADLVNTLLDQITDSAHSSF